jgi:hypothetical protein
VGLAAAMVLLAGAPVRAQEPATATDAPARIRLLPLRVSSNKLPAAELSALTDAVIEKLKRYPAYEVLPVPTQDPMDMMVDAGCTDFDADCLAAIGASVKADKVLYTEVSEKEGRFPVQLRFLDVATKELKAPEGAADARERLPELMSSALEKVLGPEPQKEPVLSHVDITTTPPGAEVYVDKDFVGQTPVSARLKAGRYTVRVAKIGYAEVLLPLTIEEGRSVQRQLNLVVAQIPFHPGPVPARREVESTPFYKTWWFWTVVGVVVVGGGTTAYLLTRSHGGPTGGALFTPDPAYAPKDVTLFPRH